MLDRGPYPEFLKNRIRGPKGHLSNTEAAELLGRTAKRQLKWACLAHLSEENNEPQIEGVDYRFGYNPSTNVIRLTPIAGVFEKHDTAAGGNDHGQVAVTPLIP